MKSTQFDGDRLLYLCCRQEMPEDMLAQVVAISDANFVNWNRLFDLAHRHGVAPLVFHNLQAAIARGVYVPAEVVGRFKLSTYQNITSKARQTETLTSVLASLQELDVDVMTVKGMALDLLVYDECWYTVAQDIDIVMRPRRRNGVKDDQARIVECVQGRDIEYEFYEHHDVTLNHALNVDFQEIWHDAKTVELSGHTLYLMCPEDMLLAACINSCRKRYFRLRSLCDIAEIIGRLPDLDWSVFVRKARHYRCNHIAYSALTATQQTVGCSLPDGMIDELDVSAPRRYVVDRLVPFLVHNVSLDSLSYYTGQELVGRRVGWSLLLPYATYRASQMISKLHEAFVDHAERTQAASLSKAE